jgi:hypothetical protein
VLTACARVTIGRRGWNSYFVCGVIGYAVGTAVALAIALDAGLGAGARLAVLGVPPLVFLGAERISSGLAGRARIVFYEQALLAIAAAVPLAALAGAPAATALDAVTLGLGAFLACGRIGCLRVGCCHGRRWRHGIRYRYEHVAAGFDPDLEGVPLVPVQLLDGAVAAALTIAGAALALGGAPAGHAAALWAIGYAVARAGLELLRGDPRPHAAGISEAQGIAVATAWAAVALWPAAPIAALAAALTAAVAVAATARLLGAPARFWIGRALDAALAAPPSSPPRTAGLAVSVHALPDGAIDVVVSRRRRALRPAELRRAAHRLAPRWRVVDVIAGATPGLCHVIVRGRDATRSARGST